MIPPEDLSPPRGPVLGWDIGGVNTKGALVLDGRVCAADSRPFELQRGPGQLAPLLRDMAADLAARAGSGDVQRPAAHAFTMTAELSQMFRTKREGVRFVVNAVEDAFDQAYIRFMTVDGHFLAPLRARAEYLQVAAANWCATARVAAWTHTDALLVDIGTTTTDIIPIVAGQVAAAGRTDPERLASGELVYTGVVRTPVEAFAAQVPWAGGMAGVSAEGFALSGDVYVWRGDLAPADYETPTPDGRPPDREFAGERLARVVCGDRELVDEDAVTAIAAALAAAQRSRVGEALARVHARHPHIRMALPAGIGAFLARQVIRDAGLRVEPLAVLAGPAAAVSVALLLDRALAGDGPREHHTTIGIPAAPDPVVVKIGGALFGHPEAFRRVMTLLDRLESPVLVVPGGGIFADAVRAAHRMNPLPDDAAHWMAVLGMDQYGHLLASQLRRGLVVRAAAEIPRALAARRIPVLAPYAWLHAEDPLPRSWDVTSDTIAAWVAGAVGARRVVLVKPPGATGADWVDPSFDHVLPRGVTAHVIPAHQIGALESVLAGAPRA